LSIYKTTKKSSELSDAIDTLNLPIQAGFQGIKSEFDDAAEWLDHSSITATRKPIQLPATIVAENYSILKFSACGFLAMRY
jgi:hypothetical protein